MDGFDIKVAICDPDFNWDEAERLAALPDFGVLAELRKLREEVKMAEERVVRLSWDAWQAGRAAKRAALAAHGLSVHCSVIRLHLAMTGEPRGFSRVTAGFSSYDGEFRQIGRASCRERV